MGDLNTNLNMACFPFHQDEATVERSDLVYVTLKGTSIHLLSRFCSAGLDPIPADTESKFSLRQPPHRRAGGTDVCMHAWQRDELTHPGYIRNGFQYCLD